MCFSFFLYSGHDGRGHFGQNNFYFAASRVTLVAAMRLVVILPFSSPPDARSLQPSWQGPVWGHRDR